MTRRERRRASDVAHLKSGKPWFTIVMIAVGLIVIFFMKSTVSDQTAGLFSELVGDPDLQLPQSVSDKEKNEDIGFKIPVGKTSNSADTDSTPVVDPNQSLRKP